MLSYLKDRIALIVFLIAGDTLSLMRLVKAAEIKDDCRNLAISISLLLSLILSLAVGYFYGPNAKKWVKAVVLSLSILSWVGYIYAYREFGRTNAQYGMIPYPANQQITNSVDSLIVGGCELTPPAQAEVQHMMNTAGMTEWNTLFADFNYNVHQIWTQQSQQCARDKILWSFSLMMSLLVAGITLTIECLLILKKPSPTEDKNNPPPKT